MTSDSFEIVSDDGSAKSIQWNQPDGAPVPEFAVEELHEYIEKISGVAPSVKTTTVDVPDHVASVLSMGDVQETKRLAETLAENLADQPPDSYVVNSNAKAMILGGTTHRGTLYAVYELLESVGVRFFAPDFPFYEGNHEYVPERTGLTVDKLDLTASPDLHYRRKYVEEGVSHTERTLVAMIDWMAKTRQNVFVCPTDYRDFGTTQWADWRDELVPELERRGHLIELGGHGFDSFLPPEENPDWYVEGCNVFDITNDDAVDAYIEGVCDYLETRPEIDIFDAWPPDVATWPDSVVEAFGSIANAYAYLTNKLVSSVKELDLDVTIEALAYQSHLETPDSEYMYDQSIIIDFAAIDRSYAHPIDDPEESANANYLDTLRQWREEFDGTMGIYEYYRKYSWHSLPVVLPKIISQEIATYRDLGLNAAGIYSEPADWIVYELVHLLMAELSWDADCDVPVYVERYLEDRYKSMAEPLALYLEDVEAAGRALFDSFDGRFDDPDAIAIARGRYERARAELSEAQEVNDARHPGAFLIRKLEANLEYAIEDLNISKGKIEADHDLEASAKQRFEEAMMDQCFSGTVLLCRFPVNRYTKLDIPSSARWPNQKYRERW